MLSLSATHGSGHCAPSRWTKRDRLARSSSQQRWAACWSIWPTIPSVTLVRRSPRRKSWQGSQNRHERLALLGQIIREKMGFQGQIVGPYQVSVFCGLAALGDVIAD